MQDPDQGAEPVAPTEGATEPAGASLNTSAAELPTSGELDQVEHEIGTVEEALRLLDKGQSPMCDACQAAFAAAGTEERMALLTCDHATAGS